MTSFDRLRFDDSQESPKIEGSRISAIQIYEMHILKGLTVNELAERFEALDIEDVKQAISYCVSHPDDVRKQATSPLTVDVVERQSKSREPTSA
jgi:uncharacterized protein (DUF433 family)